MKNGDIIHLRQPLNYYPENWAMETMEELRAPINRIDETTKLFNVVNIHRSKQLNQ